MNIQQETEELISNEASEIAQYLTEAYLEIFRNNDYNLYDFKVGLALFTGGLFSSLLTTHFPDKSLHERIISADRFCEEMRNICHRVLNEQSKISFN